MAARPKIIDLKNPEVDFNIILHYLHRPLLSELQYQAAQAILHLFRDEILEFYEAHITEDNKLITKDVDDSKKRAWQGKFRGRVGPEFEYNSIDDGFAAEFNCTDADAGAADRKYKYEYAQIGLIGRLVRMALYNGEDEEKRKCHIKPIVLLYDAMRSCNAIPDIFHRKISTIFHRIIPGYGIHLKNIYTKFKIGSNSIKEVPDEGFPGNINTLRHAKDSYIEYLREAAEAASKAAPNAAPNAAPKAATKASKKTKKYTAASTKADNNNDYPYDPSIKCNSFDKLRVYIKDEKTEGCVSESNVTNITHNFNILRNILDSIGVSNSSVRELISKINKNLKTQSIKTIIARRREFGGLNQLEELERIVKALCAARTVEISAAAIAATPEARAARATSALNVIIEMMKKSTVGDNRISTRKITQFDSERNMQEVIFTDGTCIKLVKFKGNKKPHSFFIFNDFDGTITRNPVEAPAVGGAGAAPEEVYYIYDSSNTYSIQLCIPGEKPPKVGTKLGKKATGKHRTRKLFIGGVRRTYRHTIRRKNKYNMRK